MKIALLCTSFPLSQKDEVIFPATWELTHALQKQGHELLVITLGPDGPKQPTKTTVDGIRVISIPWGADAAKTCFTGIPSLSMFSFAMARARLILEPVRNELAEFQPDIVETQEFVGLGFFYASEHKYPLVVRCYGPISLHMRDEQYGCFDPADACLTEGVELATLCAADALISICNDLARTLSAKSGRPLEDFQIIRTPLTIPPATIPDKTIGLVDQPKLFYWGRVEKQKGVDILIEALPLIAAEFPKFTLRIAGEHTYLHGESIPFASTLQSRLQQLSLDQNVQFLGRLPREKIIEEVQAADICVFPSKYETACYTALEAITYGGIPVATKVGGLPEYHIHGESAWLVEPFSPKELAKGILDLLADPDRRARMRSVGRAHVHRMCDPDSIARQSIKVYEQAIQAFRSSTANADPARRDLAFRAIAGGIFAALPDGSVHEYLAQSIRAETDRAYENGRQDGMRQAVNARTTFGSLAWAAARMTKRLITGAK